MGRAKAGGMTWKGFWPVAQTWAVDIACNDNGGRFDGRARGIQLLSESSLIDLEPTREEGCLMLINRSQVNMHGALFDIVRIETWYGSVAWNRYWFNYQTYQRFIDAVWDSGLWSCSIAPCEFSWAWDKGAFA
jgi:hypothetical protein